jgi:hypothetical protein
VKRLFLVVALLAWAIPAQAQIAFEDAVDGGDTTGTSLSSFNVDCGSAGNCAVNVCVAGDLTGGSDDVSVTIDGGAASLVAKTTSTTNRIAYQFARTGLTTGNKAVVVSAGSSHYLAAVAASHTGVDSTGEPHATDDDAPGNVADITLNVTANANSWLIGCTYKHFQSSFPAEAGTGATRREYGPQGSTFNTLAIFDSNGTVSGSASMQALYNGTMDLGIFTFLMGAFDDAGGGGGGSTCSGGFMLRGAGGC